MSISRREFIGTAAIGGAMVPAALGAGGSKLPMRTLGRTGAKVSLLGFGCGSRFLMYKEEDKAVEVLNHAIDLGINYIDTAYAYGDGESETRVGRVMAKRRKEVFLVTKLFERNGDKAMRVLEGSLKRLQTDHVDLLHVHGLSTSEDLAKIEAPDGVLKLFYKLRDQKVARAIGVTCHSDPAVLKTAIERNDFDCTQMALNAALTGMGEGVRDYDMSTTFQTVAMTAALKKKMGVTAMKVFAQEQLSGKAPAEKLLRYSMTLPVSAVVVGMPKLEFLESNVAVARDFAPMAPSEMQEMSSELSRQHKASIDRFFLDHQDA